MSEKLSAVQNENGTQNGTQNENQQENQNENQQESTDTGLLQVNVITDRFRPVSNAKVSISYTGDPTTILHELNTDDSGQTQGIELPAPPVQMSLDENNIVQPYAEYTVQVKADGYEPADVSGVQLLSGRLAIQTIYLRPVAEGVIPQNIVIPAHTLYGEFPPKIAEAEIKPIDESGEIVLSRVVVPEYVVVHDGVPSDTTAANYYIRYPDYIKNVASSEIYATWPRSSIEANVLAIMSFTLNRVFTEWYRNKGYNFTITSSTAFDHKFVYGRNIYDSISLIVDENLGRYLSRPNVKQPILTQYCDGRRVQCPNWMTQWGSQNLGEQGYSALDILRHFYGDNMYINTAEQISGVPSSWPGANLDIGSSGDNVRMIQEQLNAIADVYGAIPHVSTDGIYGEGTKASVRKFQEVFGLPQTGIVDYTTWYRISQIYVAVTRIGELQ